MEILICDDHELFGHGLMFLFEKADFNYNLSYAQNTKTCIEIVSNSRFDVFICDLNLGKEDGFSLVEVLKPHLKETKTIILSAYHDEGLLKKARKLGCFAFLKKETSFKELERVIQSVNTSELNFQSETKLNGKNESYEHPVFKSKLLLSKQETIVIREIVTGKTSQEIADTLFISKNTIDTHRKNINRKLKIKNTGALIKFAHENNLST